MDDLDYDAYLDCFSEFASKNCALHPLHSSTENNLAWLLSSRLVLAADSWLFDSTLKART